MNVNGRTYGTNNQTPASGGGRERTSGMGHDGPAGERGRKGNGAKRNGLLGRNTSFGVEIG